MGKKDTSRKLRYGLCWDQVKSEPLYAYHEDASNCNEEEFTKFNQNAYYSKKQYSCTSCESSFTHKASLNYHLRNECGRTPRFLCPYCPCRCTRLSNVFRHMRNRHAGKEIYCLDTSMNPHLRRTPDFGRIPTHLNLR